MKKRIGIVMYQTSKSKGQELVAQRMVAYFNKLGHDAYLITSIYHDGREVVSEQAIGERGYVCVRETELGIPIIRVASFVTKWPPRRIIFRDVVHTLERIVNEFQLNVMVTHSTLWNGPEEVAKFVEWRRNIKALGGFQDPLVFCHMSHFQEPSPKRYSLSERSFRMAWNRLSLRTILRVANLILVVTPLEEEEKVKMGAAREKCILFPGGIDDDSFIRNASVDPEELLRQLKLARDVKIISYLGTIEKRKNPSAVLEVAGRLKDRADIHFVIAGRGDSEYADEVRRGAEGLPNSTYLGEIGEKEKVQLIRVSYLDILLSKMEALGLTQLEFMYEGVPVITSAVGGQSWLIQHNREGIHVKDPGDIEGAAKAIVELVDEPSKRQKLSENARERANAFTLSKLVAKLDLAITKELERESGLSKLPPEVRSTLSEPELVVKTWSHGTRKAVATNKRIFVQQGMLSRSTLEMPYSSIGAIEHIRKYHWKTLMMGSALSLLLLIQHYLFPVISRTVTSKIVYFISLIPGVRAELPHIVEVLWLLPICATLVLFLVRARKGYTVHASGSGPIYLPHSFKETVEHIRKMQNSSKMKTSSSTDHKKEETTKEQE